MPAFSTVSQQRLATCDIRLQVLLNELIKHVDFTVLEGHRGEAAQNQAFLEGKSTKKWPHGNHNSMPSRAVDIAPVFLDVKGKIDWKDYIAFGRLMGMLDMLAKTRNIKLRFGLDWDGDFRSVDQDPDESFLDAPHVELIDG